VSNPSRGGPKPGSDGQVGPGLLWLLKGTLRGIGIGRHEEPATERPTVLDGVKAQAVGGWHAVEGCGCRKYRPYCGALLPTVQSAYHLGHRLGS
jgi:hypothetical protein